MGTAGNPENPYASFGEATASLEQLARELGVKHLSYWCVSFAGDTPDQVTWVATYDPAYMSHYMANYTPLGDPVFDLEYDFIDWAQVNAEDPAAQLMQDQAEKFGIARHGITYRFRDKPDLRVLFSANIDCADADWPWRREALVDQLFNLAHRFHRRAKPLVDNRRKAA